MLRKNMLMNFIFSFPEYCLISFSQVLIKICSQQKCYQEMCELKMAGMCRNRKASKYSSKTMIPSWQVNATNWNF